MTHLIGSAPLVWGTGPLELDVFLEPTCPFSNNVFKKLKPFIALMGEEKITVRVYLHVQPWHFFSGVIVRTVLAAALFAGGEDAAWRVLDAVADHRDEFDALDHCKGALMEVTPTDILQRIETYTDLNLVKAFEEEAVTVWLKRHTRYARQNGIHVSPTIMLNGLIDERFSSGDTIEQWAQYCR